jgi:3-methyladenine DNA glycosylase AlkC
MQALKDFINRESIRQLGAAIAAVDPDFAVERFTTDALRGLRRLELKARIDHVARSLGRHLPPDFPAAARDVAAVVDDRSLNVWAAWPVTVWISEAGIDHFEESVALLEHVTATASAEFAVRPFIDKRPKEMQRVLRRWARSKDPHVRRLASEGTRPRLPWAPRLTATGDDHGWALFVLDILRDDPSESVRKSVANHLNDICKLDRDLGLATAERWIDAGGTHVAWVTRHGLRTLVKRGDPRALALLGADANARVEIAALKLARRRLRLGEPLEFSFRIRNAEQSSVVAVIDYAIHFVKSDGSRGRKVFKLKTVELSPEQEMPLSRRFPIREITTRRYYAGKHRLEIQCNGVVGASTEFHLDVPTANR